MLKKALCINNYWKVLLFCLFFLIFFNSCKQKKYDLCGYINRDGEIVIEPEYLDAKDFSEGLACVENEDFQWGYIDKKGKTIIDFKYEAAYSFSEELAIVLNKNGKWEYLDKKGRVIIRTNYKDISSFSEGLARVKDENDKWGYINKTGEIIIEPKYLEAEDFSDGLACVKKDEKKIIYIDKSGKMVFSFDNELIDPTCSSFINGYLIIKCKEYTGYYWIEYDRKTNTNRFAGNDYEYSYSYINTLGKRVFNKSFKDVSPFYEGLAAVKYNNDKYGYIDKTGRIVIKPEFENALKFSEGLARVETNTDWYYIDIKGKVKFRIKYDTPNYDYGFLNSDENAQSSFSEGISRIRLYNDRYIYVNKIGERLNNQTYIKARKFSEGLALITIGY